MYGKTDICARFLKAEQPQENPYRIKNKKESYVCIYVYLYKYVSETERIFHYTRAKILTLENKIKIQSDTNYETFPTRYGVVRK